MTKNDIIGKCMLLFAALAMGFAFVFQSSGLDIIGPFTLNGLRFSLGCLCLIPICLFFEHRKKAAVEKSGSETALYGQPKWKEVMKGGLVCGILLACASNLQFTGLMTSTAAKAGFITVLYILIVPILELFTGKKIKAQTAIAVVFGITGFYMLGSGGGMNFSTGVLTGENVFLLAGAMCFALHIMAVDHFLEKVDSLWLSAARFGVAGIVSAVVMFILEKPTITAIHAAGACILYSAIVSGALAYTLQNKGQEVVPPTQASFILSLESVISLLAGWVLLKERLSDLEIMGCMVIFAGILPMITDGVTKDIKRKIERKITNRVHRVKSIRRIKHLRRF